MCIQRIITFNVELTITNAISKNLPSSGTKWLSIMTNIHLPGSPIWKKNRSPSYRIHFCRFSSNKQYAKIAISGIALQFELWYCKNDLNGLLIFNFNFKTILTCLLFFKVVKVNCEWRLIKQKPYINQPNFVIILGNEKCDTFSRLFKHVNLRLLIWYK